MKKTFLFLAALCMCSVSTFAQLKVTSDGKVGIGIGSQTPISSNLAVGTVGDTTFPNNFFSDNNTMQIGSNGTYSLMGNSVTSLNVWMESTASRIYFGLMVSAVKLAPSNNGRTAGIQTTAGNATSGYNHAIIGSLCGSNFGAGIFGSANCAGSAYIDGLYAGYFDGNVKVTGTLNGTVISPSDIRFKQNVAELGGGDSGNRDVLNNITTLNPVSYNYRQVYHELPPSDTLQAPVGMFDENSQVFHKNHYGLIAQDLQQIYPDLVYENDNGYLSINYTELIPLLIQSIKELKEEVDMLSSALVGVRSTTTNGFMDESSHAVLYQNAPNPFSERTEIKFDLPENAKNAFIYIFNMQGTLVKQISISAKQRSVLINGSELTAGMYMYSLIVDGKEVDTKKMILTK